MKNIGRSRGPVANIGEAREVLLDYTCSKLTSPLCSLFLAFPIVHTARYRRYLRPEALHPLANAISNQQTLRNAADQLWKYRFHGSGRHARQGEEGLGSRNVSSPKPSLLIVVVVVVIVVVGYGTIDTRAEVGVEAWVEDGQGVLRPAQAFFNETYGGAASSLGKPSFFFLYLILVVVLTTVPFGGTRGVGRSGRGGRSRLVRSKLCTYQVDIKPVLIYQCGIIMIKT